MILFLSDGRLGNQLFQYTFLNTIAKENEKIITANMEQFVDKFEIGNKNFKHKKLGKYSLLFIRRVIKPYFLTFLISLKIISYIKQETNKTSFLPTYIRKNGFLPITFVETNFFQSEDFFDSKNVDFSIKEKYILEARDFLATIPEEYTKVFIHIRRGDYIFESYLDTQGLDLPKSYFINSIEKINKDINNPFFVFLSDDFAYVRDCFENIENKIISKNSMATDLAIMSLCDAGICSNSSFSWWGAYLMKNRIKVIMPKYWYGWKQKIESHIDIQPKWAEQMEVEY